MGKARRGRGEGSIEELPSGRVRAVVSLGVDPGTGKRAKLSKTFGRKADAIAWRNDRQRERDGGTLTATAATLGDWLTTWLSVRKPEVAANTYRTESDTAERRVRPALGNVRLRDLTPLSVEKWFARMAEEGVPQNERHKCGKLLRTCLNDAVRRKVIGSSPLRGLTIPQPPESEARSLTREQLAALLTAATELGHGAMFRLWADAGLRPGELYALAVADFDAAAGTISVRSSLCQTTGRVKATKTKGSRRTLDLAPSTAAALAEWVAGRTTKTAPLFPAPEGGHWWRHSFVTLVFGPVARRAGLTEVLVPYSCRHTMATLLLHDGDSIKSVSERLGHRDITTTLKTYCHAIPGAQKQSAARMERFLNPGSSPDRPTGHTSTPVQTTQPPSVTGVGSMPDRS